MDLSGEFKAGLIVTVVVTILAASSWPWWAEYVGLGSKSSATTATHSPVLGMSGGCESFQAFAQNRWTPVGTTVREAPNVLSGSVRTFPPNMSIAVNGWVHGRPAYPTNTAPWNNDIWFHLADNLGWVSFAGIRAYPTSFDPTGLADGGPAVATSPACAGAVQ
jgi:hypothetical protein